MEDWMEGIERKDWDQDQEQIRIDGFRWIGWVGKR